MQTGQVKPAAITSRISRSQRHLRCRSSENPNTTLGLLLANESSADPSTLLVYRRITTPELAPFRHSDTSPLVRCHRKSIVPQQFPIFLMDKIDYPSFSGN